MDRLTPLAQVCVTLIDENLLVIDETPEIVYEEVKNYYTKLEEEI